MVLTRVGDLHESNPTLTDTFVRSESNIVPTESVLVCHIPISWGWSGGAKVLGKLSVPGRPSNLDNSRARAYCACSRCGWGWFGHVFSRLSFLPSFSPSLGDGPI